MKKKIVSLLVCILLLTACGGNSYETINADRVRE
jgi:predicted small secreted protein